MTDPAPIFAAFDQVRIVNLPSRTDRRAEMQSELAKVGMADDPRVAFFPAIACDDSGPFLRVGSHGNFLGRLAILKEAVAANASVLILEDDCDFLLPEILEYELPAEWDIFYGGFEFLGDGDPADSDIIGSHFMGFSREAAPVVLDYLTRYLEPDFPLDPQASQEPGFDPAIRPPIDGAFVWLRRAHPELKTVFCKVGVQRASRTDVGDQRFFDRIPIVRDLVGIARRALRGVRGTSRSMKESNLR